MGDRIIKVNHAGEHGAIQIYSAQMFMARLTAAHMLDELADFREHERRHRSIFAAELQRRRRPRCRSYWLCGAGGYGLGLITGLLGGSAIAATTVAIERVVLAHLEKQLNVLKGKDPEAVAAIAAVVDEEREHHDRSARRVRPGTFWQKALTPVVSASTEAVIWLGMRL
ncbi:MAG TPA: demethoxyubiquinone hydroxylase family protein [Lysobacter sp.]